MGWGSCGEDDQGRPIGYNHVGNCDHPGCNVEITRGLECACGGMHGQGEYSCARYFCSEHLGHLVETDQGSVEAVCNQCALTLLTSGDWHFDLEANAIRRAPNKA